VQKTTEKQIMNNFLTTYHVPVIRKICALLALVVLSIVTVTPAMADRKHITVIRETIYYAPARIIVQPSVIFPISHSHYLGLGSKSYIHSSHAHSTVYREVNRHDNYYDRGFRHADRNNKVWGHRDNGHRSYEQARGRWSGANRHREVIYVDRDGRRGSSYREAERRSVIIRERSR
jgi:hypothetical protein